jgi:hypothetical protein
MDPNTSFLMELSTILYNGCDFTSVREATCFEFGKDFLPINDNVENSSRARNHLRIHTKALFEFCCQTGSFGFIVSLHAICD